MQVPLWQILLVWHPPPAQHVCPTAPQPAWQVPCTQCTLPPWFAQPSVPFGGGLQQGCPVSPQPAATQVVPMQVAPVAQVLFSQQGWFAAPHA